LLEMVMDNGGVGGGSSGSMLEPSVRLRRAVVNGNLPAVRRLVRRYPGLLENVDAKNGWTSLHYAGYHGHYLVCVFLVQQGHDQEEISLDHGRNTPLHLAASQNHEQTVHFLAQHIPRCLDWRNRDWETALLVAARRGHDPCINLLLDFGADINRGNAEGNRPIHVAAAYGHIKTLRTLVDRNADVQTPNAEGWRPVQYCSTYQVQDFLQSLIHEKAESTKKQQAFFKSPKPTPHSPPPRPPPKDAPATPPPPPLPQPQFQQPISPRSTPRSRLLDVSVANVHSPRRTSD
jgi:ankyrin repeat protein